MLERFPPGGYPIGWYPVSASRRLAPGQIEPVRYFGRDLALYRTQGGAARLVDRVCPHLGASMSLGRVDGENIVCGMHGFEFGEDGRCVKLAYGTRPPPTARLTSYPIQEVNGYVYTFYSPDGAEPGWKIEPLDWDGWTPLRHERLEFRGHPQETTENSVDIGHFKAVHYYNASVEQAPLADGEKLTSAYRVVRPWFGRRFPNVTFEVGFNVLVHGLGYSLIHATVDHTPISIRFYANAIPIDGERMHLHIAAAIRKLPVPGLNRIIREAVFAGLRHDVTQDIPFWESKHYLEKPLLAEGDGPIAVYRRWCRQFYAAPPMLRPPPGPDPNAFPRGSTPH
jgi:phenylpropionate dioxygenase-like ring-hydroxylating dioxygenase large terminal subunit